jgi:hypothetical protein
MDFQPLNHGQDEAGCLSRASFGHADNISSVHDGRDRLALNGGWVLVTFARNRF